MLSACAARLPRGEIKAALRSPLPPHTLDGLKRRTGAMLGDCQGNICLPRLIQLYQQQGYDPLALNKHYEGSEPVVARIAGREGE